MTTDITELAQSLKAAAEKATQGNWRAFKYHDGRCGIGGGHHDEIMVCEHISKRRPHDAEFIALANPANILALVEALEKAQQRIVELQQGCENDPRIHEIIDLKERIDNLESFRTAYMEWGEKTDWVQTDKRFDVLKPWGKHRADVLKEYIQHLESRTVTVKLTDINEYLAEVHDKTLNQAFRLLAEGVRAGDVAAMRAAGIKVEAE